MWRFAFGRSGSNSSPASNGPVAGEHAADLYIGEYVAIREALRKMETEETLKEAGSDDLPVIEALKKAQKLGDGK